jgi:hypothetical protein
MAVTRSKPATRTQENWGPEENPSEILKSTDPTKTVQKDAKKTI